MSPVERVTTGEPTLRAGAQDATQAPTTSPTVGEILRSAFRRHVPPLNVLDVLIYRQDPHDVMDHAWPQGRRRHLGG